MLSKQLKSVDWFLLSSAPARGKIILSPQHFEMTFCERTRANGGQITLSKSKLQSQVEYNPPTLQYWWLGPPSVDLSWFAYWQWHKSHVSSERKVSWKSEQILGYYIDQGKSQTSHYSFLKLGKDIKTVHSNSCLAKSHKNTHFSLRVMYSKWQKVITSSVFMYSSAE